MTERFDVAALGSAAVDELLWVGAYPPADTKVPVLRRARLCGGVSATALVAASRLGARAAYAGILGQAESSQFVLDALHAAGVDTSHVCDYPSATPALSVIVLDETHKTRTILYDITGFTGPDDDWLPSALLRNTRVLLVDNFRMDLTIRAARVARDAGATILGDLEDPAVPRRDELLALVDHLIVSRDYASAVTGEPDPRRAALKLQAPGRVVAVTCGADGAWYLADGPVVHQPAFAIEAVDTNGCGDVFHGAYAAALVHGLELGERIRFASAVAALFATTPTGQQGIPDIADVDRFLKEHS